MRIYLLVAITFFFYSSFNAKAQDTFDDFTYKAIQSPNAYSLGKFGDIPVSLYTGIPSISIPITGINAGSFTLPVSLDYHAGGIKAQEKASWVGLGWALNAGGVITRSPRGEADDDKQWLGYLYYGDEGLDHPIMDWGADGSSLSQSELYDVHYLVKWKLDRGRGVAYDTEPDIFFYNFAGRSGQFVLPLDLLDVNEAIDQTVEIQTIPHSNLKIKATSIDNEGIVSWSITDEEGIKYTFDKEEVHVMSGNNVLAGGSFPVGTKVVDNRISWYLSKIEFPGSSEIIQLKYTDKENAYYHNRTISLQNLEPNLPSYNSSHFTSFLRYVNHTTSHHKVRRLSSIESNSHVLHFNTAAQPDRYDAPKYTSYDDQLAFPLGVEEQEYKLQSLKLYKKHGNDSSEVKRWNFNFSYFNNSVANDLGHSSSVNEPDLFKRLKLTSIDIADKNDNTEQSYSFEYHEPQFAFKYFDHANDQFVTTSVNVTLPAYLDFSEQDIDLSISPTPYYHFQYTPAYDHWGFFNGEFENAMYNVPQVDYSNYHGPNSVNRQPNETAMKSGTLSKIVYPTGGYTEFTFEANKYDAVGWQERSSTNTAGGLRIKKIESASDNSTSPVVKTYRYTEGTGTESSGVLVNEPMYLKQYFLQTQGSDDDATWGFGESSLIPLGTTLGGIVGYKEVKVLYGESEDKGYEISTFSSAEEFPDTLYNAFLVDEYNNTGSGGQTIDVLDWGLRTYYIDNIDTSDYYTNNASKMKWGFGFRSSIDSRRGKLLSHTVYNASDKKLQKTVNSYYDSYVENSSTSATHNRYFGMSASNVEEMRSYGCCTTEEVYFAQTYIIQYEHISSWNYLKDQTLISYDPVTGDSLIASTRYEYDEGHLQLTKEVRKNSNSQDSVKTSYKYAHEQYTAMETANMLTQPYSILLEDGNGNDISKNWTIWSNTISGAVSGAWLPKEQWSWKSTGTAPATPTISNAIKNSEISKYDSYGNPLEIEDVNGAKTKFYYGSNASPFSQTGLDGINGKYLTGIQKVLGTDNCSSNCGTRPGGVDDLFTEAEYDSYGRITSITDENEQTNTFEYDDFNRLTKTENPFGGVTKNNYFYSRESSGSYNTSAPNMVETVTGTDSFESNFESSTGFTYYGEYIFNHTFDGKKTLKMGDDLGNWTSVYRSPGEENIFAKVDVYPSSSYISATHAYVLAFNDGASGSPNRCAVRYDSSLDKFYMFYRFNNASWTSTYPFSATAAPNKWYTIEIEKREGLCMAWVYEQGASRSSGEYFEVDGFPATLTPDVRIWAKDDEIYLTELEYTANPQTSISYLDGLGREIQFQIRGAGEVISTETLYNDLGLPEVISRPAKVTGSGYATNMLTGTINGTTGELELNNTSLVESYYDGYVGSDATYAYSHSGYEASPLTRPTTAQLPGSTNRIANTSYGVNTTESFSTSAVTGLIGAKTWAAKTLTKIISEDPSGNKTISYANGWGQTVASGVDMDNNSKLDRGTTDLVTEFAYDERGNLVLVEDPRGLQTKYWYNTLGQLNKKELPDQDHLNRYKYDERGNLRFIQSPNHIDNDSSYSTIGSLSWTSSGTKSATFSGNGMLGYSGTMNGTGSNVLGLSIKDPAGLTILVTSPVPNQGSISGNKFAYNGDYDFTVSHLSITGPYTFSLTATYKPFKFSYTEYDELSRITETGEYFGVDDFHEADPNTSLSSDRYVTKRYFYDSPYSSANNTKGRLSKLEYLESTGNWGETLYSYNNLGLVEWVIQKVPGITGDIKITYTYDELGRQTEMGYNVTNASDDHYYWYEYDELGRLEYVYSDTDSNPTGRIKEAEYVSYFADGQVAQMKLGNGNIQTVDYNYTVQGWLGSLNNSSVSSSTNGDRFALALGYANNGNITTQTWMQSSLSTGYSVKYDYTYDKANRLTAADYTNNNSSALDDNGNGYDISPITYDKNGNITSIIRKGQGYYSYPFNSITSTTISGTNNRLTSYGLQNGPTPTSTKTVTYDANGNILQNRFTNATYDWRNLATSVKSGATTIEFGYDGDGNRVRKEVIEGIESIYVRGVDGQTIAVYENGSRAFVNLLAGGGILGTYDGSQRRYFLKDHLGTVRTTVDQSGNVDGYDDYYPFGLVMDGRSNNTSNPDDLYKFTGYEEDNEAGLGMYHANARSYDPVLGRFMQIDPMSAKYPGISPYAYVANNPLAFIDPTGMVIDPASQKEWDRQKGYVTRKRDRLQRRANRLRAKAERKGWSANKLNRRLGNTEQRVASLNSTISTLGAIESSEQVYSLNNVGNSEGQGYTSYDTESGNIVINYTGNTGNFVHEATHAGQFESGQVAYYSNGSAAGADLYDEVAAYTAEFAYDGSSVKALGASSFSAINTSWVRGIRNPKTGEAVYRNSGILPINVNTSLGFMGIAYPRHNFPYHKYNPELKLRNWPGLIYKK